jgi:hypothetical protein
MGSPGTFSLSPQKSNTIRKLLGRDFSQTSRKGLTEPAPLAAAFFREIFRERDWTGLITGREWRKCASLLLKGVGEARVLSRRDLESWLEKQKIEAGTASPLIEWGDRWIEKLDKELSDRNVIGFELSTYALRQTLEDLYSPDKSPFDLTRTALIEELKTVDTRTAFRAYVQSYLRQVIHYVMAGYPPKDAEDDQKLSKFMDTVEKQEIPKLANQFLSALEKYSGTKGRAGQALSVVLEDVPEWVDISKRILTGEAKK